MFRFLLLLLQGCDGRLLCKTVRKWKTTSDYSRERERETWWQFEHSQGGPTSLKILCAFGETGPARVGWVFARVFHGRLAQPASNNFQRVPKGLLSMVPSRCVGDIFTPHPRPPPPLFPSHSVFATMSSCAEYLIERCPFMPLISPSSLFRFLIH